MAKVHVISAKHLADAPDFISMPPKLTMEEMIKSCEAMLPYWNVERYSKPEPIVVMEEFVLEDD